MTIFKSMWSSMNFIGSALTFFYFSALIPFSCSFLPVSVCFSSFIEISVPAHSQSQKHTFFGFLG
jgi:hypothetical protein